MSRISDLPNSERPRERLALFGADRVSNAELIAILLRTGIKGRSAMEVANEVLSKFQTLNALAQARIEDLQEVDGIGPDKAIALKSAFTLAHRMALEIRTETPLLDSAEKIAHLLREENRHYEVERLQVVSLNTRRRLVRVDHVSQGLLDTVLAHPREVFRFAIQANAAAVVIVHNHPSGDPTPSPNDIKVTRDLIRAGQLLRIEVLDHIILGKKNEERERDYVSLRELGYFGS